MKGITEMTEQEILALTEEDVQKLIKLRMMEEGIKIMDKPEVPELFGIVFITIEQPKLIRNIRV